MIEILPMQVQHVGQVARLHIENLQTNFRGRAGGELLTLYYATLTNESGGCGYVSLVDNQVMGYVCGIWDAADVKRYLFHHYGAQVIFWATAQLVTCPSLLKDNLLRVRSNGGISTAVAESGYELRPIVVSKMKRGSGIANLLTTHLLEDASVRGFSVVHLYTEQGNTAARKFYSRVGFYEIGLAERFGQPYIRFEHRVAKL